MPEGQAPQGRDTVVELVGEDGTVERLDNVMGLTINVAGRHAPVEATLRIQNVELDVEAREPDHTSSDVSSPPG